jgi:hypothetical protein
MSIVQVNLKIRAETSTRIKVLPRAAVNSFRALISDRAIINKNGLELCLDRKL